MKVKKPISKAAERVFRYLESLPQYKEPVRGTKAAEQVDKLKALIAKAREAK